MGWRRAVASSTAMPFARGLGCTSWIRNGMEQWRGLAGPWSMLRTGAAINRRTRDSSPRPRRRRRKILGIPKEPELARSWLVELARAPAETLAQTWTPKLKDVTDSLETAFNQRNDAVSALVPQQTSVALLINDVNRELDRLEGDLKKLFPGAPERAASYLMATRAITARPSAPSRQRQYPLSRRSEGAQSVGRGCSSTGDPFPGPAGHTRPTCMVRGSPGVHIRPPCKVRDDSAMLTRPAFWVRCSSAVHTRPPCKVRGDSAMLTRPAFGVRCSSAVLTQPPCCHSPARARIRGSGKRNLAGRNEDAAVVLAPRKRR